VQEVEPEVLKAAPIDRLDDEQPRAGDAHRLGEYRLGSLAMVEHERDQRRIERVLGERQSRPNRRWRKALSRAETVRHPPRRSTLASAYAPPRRPSPRLRRGPAGAGR